MWSMSAKQVSPLSYIFIHNNNENSYNDENNIIRVGLSSSLCRAWSPPMQIQTCETSKVMKLENQDWLEYLPKYDNKYAKMLMT